MKKTLISILGPTAVGKTSFALKLANEALELTDSKTGKKKFSGVDLISADSRQVYKGLEVLSGADIPQGFIWVGAGETQLGKTPIGKTSPFPVYPYFKNNQIYLHGVLILEPMEEWSVTHFKNFAINIIKNSFATNRLPIIVGGSNLYINNLFNRDQNLYVSPNTEIRAKADSMSVEELQLWLKSVNSEKYAIMNHSDINNPRRLIRAIEISVGEPAVEEIINLPKDLINLKIGLKLSSDPKKNLEEIFQKITQRVIERFKNGAIEEVKRLAQKNCQDNDQTTNFSVCSTLGVSDINSYLNNEIDQEKCLENWALHEFQYAKRQLVWLKKEKPLVWLDDLTKSSYNLFNEKIFI